MNNLNMYDNEVYKIYEGNNDYNNLPTDEGLIGKKLPPEIFEKVLSYLDDMSTHEAVLVSRFWSEATVRTAKHKEFSKIKDFVKFLDKNLKEESYASEKENLLNIFSSREILNSVNLMQVKSLIHSCKEDVLNTLKNLTENDLKKLEASSKNEPKPKFFENVFNLARIYKEIDEAGQILDDTERGYALKNISNILAQSGSFHKAIEVANKILDDAEREDTFQYISMALAQSGSFHKAIEVANKILDDTKREDAFEYISIALAHCGSFHKAIKVAKTIPDDTVKWDAFRYISKALAENDRIDDAIGVAKTIPPSKKQLHALQDISIVLVVRNKIDDAIEVANKILDDTEREDAFRYISKALVENNRIDDAIEFAKKIPSDTEIGYFAQRNALLYISKSLLQDFDVEKAIEVLNTTPSLIKRMDAFKDISMVST